MAEQIGEITILHGTATAEGADGVRELTLGSPIYNGEIIATGPKGAVEIQFSDGALLSQGPSSQVHLDDYVFDPDTDAGEITMDLLEGTFRSVTGQIVDMNPEGFKILTPNTTIGIRGTTTGHIVGSGGEEEHVVIDFVDKPVVFRPTTGGPVRVITQDGIGITASPAGISQPAPASARVLSNLDQLSSDSMQRSAPTLDANEQPDDDGDQTDDNGGQDQEVQGEQEARQDGGEPVNEEAAQEGLPGEIQETMVVEVEMQPQPGMGPVQGLLPGGTPLAAMPVPEQAPPIPQLVQPILAPVKTMPEKVETEKDNSTTTSTSIDLTAETDAMTIDLLGASPAYYEVTGDSSTRVNLSDSVKDAYGSLTASNTITGDEQDNKLFGGAASDTIAGGTGNDTIYGGGGGDNLSGGAGTDVLTYADLTTGVTVDLASSATYGAYTDTLSGFEHVIGTDSNDTVYGDSGDNSIEGGSGIDFLWGGSGGSDSLFGGDGNDNFKFEHDVTGGTVDGGAGTDQLQVWATCDLTGLDSVTNVEKLYFKAAGSSVTVEAKDFSDFTSSFGPTLDVMSTSSTETLTIKTFETAGSALDLSAMQFGANWESGDKINLYGYTGNDTLTGSDARDTIEAGAGNDIVYGSAGSDSFNGDTGTDTISYANVSGSVNLSFTSASATDGEGGTDTLAGFEVAIGSAQDDTLIGSGNAETLIGGASNDSLQGVGGNDVLEGGLGTDYLYGGSGLDTMTGGGGNDTFYYNNEFDGEDVIKDFVSGADQFYLCDTGFSLTAGSLSFSEFKEVTDSAFLTDGSTGLDADDRIIFYNDGTTQALYYDEDGSTAGNHYLLATFESDPGNITEADFVVV